MELRHLRYFIAAAEHESVRLASERIHVTQPAISRQIQQLEEELGVLLFERTPRGLRLTDAGTVYLEEARKVLALLDAAGRAARLTADGMRGRLRVGFVDNAAWDGVVPDIFERFQSAAPGVKLELFPNNTPIQIADIASGALDGGFVYLFEALPETFRVLPVASHRVVLAVPRKWDLPAHATLKAATLSGRPFVTFPRATYPGYHDQLMGACAGAGLTLDVVQEVSTEAAILSLVSAGVGAALVNSANLSRPPAQVRFLELEDIVLTLPLAFAYSGANRNAALKRFLDCLTEVAGAA